MPRYLIHGQGRVEQWDADSEVVKLAIPIIVLRMVAPLLQFAVVHILSLVRELIKLVPRLVEVPAASFYCGVENFVVRVHVVVVLYLDQVALQLLRRIDREILKQRELLLRRRLLIFRAASTLAHLD